VTKVRHVLRRAFGYDSLAQYAVVGLRHPQDQVRVTVVGPRFGERDVTGCNVVVSLRPFLVAVSLPAEVASSTAEVADLDLVFNETQLACSSELGRIALHPWQVLPWGDSRFWIFRPGKHRDRCLDPVRLSAYYAEQWWRRRRDDKPGNFQMTFGDLIRIWTFYVCPRPVALITVQHGGYGNIFPMDLIGPTIDPAGFSLALRSSSPSVRLIAESRRVAVSRVPIELKGPVVDLGKHHRLSSIDWKTLPFGTEASQVLGLPVPADALGVRELEIDQVHAIGSHTLFLGRTISHTLTDRGPGMFHISGLYQEYLRRQGRPRQPFEFPSKPVR
jgi:flavin reductase (DIM6/NTAB) family NADH-FMN oxidoreductase RutF